MLTYPNNTKKLGKPVTYARAFYQAFYQKIIRTYINEHTTIHDAILEARVIISIRIVG